MARFWLVLCLVFSSFNLFANPVHLEHSTASLISEYDTVKPDDSFYVAFKLHTKPGWHVYWKNPGDSGMAPRLKWELPPTLKAGDIEWLPPKKIKVAHLMNYGYEGEAYFLVKLKNEGHLKPGPLSISARADWLICKEDCVPEEALLHLNLNVGDESVPSQDNFVLSSQLDRLGAIQPLKAKVALGNKMLYLAIDPKDLVSNDIKSLYFFPAHEGVIESAAKQMWSKDQKLLQIEMKRDTAVLKKDFSGLLQLNMGNHMDYYQVSAKIDPAMSTATNQVDYGLWFILAMAFLGGIILNAMPCVFPVLSIKALSIAKKAQASKGEIRRQSLAYTAGVVASFLVLAGLLVALKSAGQSIGWGYQLQSPSFVTILIYILFLVGLNLSGYFEISWMMGHVTSADRDDYIGSFMTGVLATLVATPCTAPFMATAVGYALTQTGAHTFLVFTVLALGLASPFLMLSFFPGLLCCFPKPGHWMVTLREILAFPVFLSCVWLLWVLMHQVEANLMFLVMAGLVFITMYFWFESTLREASPVAKWFTRVVVLCLILWPFYAFNAAEDAYKEVEYTPQRLQSLTSQHKPVFVHATAAWCITCKANEMLVLSKSRIKDAFQDAGITVIKADWTNKDPTVTHLLEKYNRSGVPLYVFYPKKGEPVVLPQLLTESIVLEAIKRE